MSEHSKIPPASMDLAGITVENGDSSNVPGPEMQNDQSSVNDSEHSSDQTLITAGSLMDHSEHYPFVTAAAAFTVQASTTPFTARNLDQHNQQHEEELSHVIDLDEDQRLFGEHVENLRLTLQSLGVDEVPDYFLIDLALKYDGMVPMERLWAEYEGSFLVEAMREEHYTQDDLERDLEGFEGFEGYEEE